MHHTCEPPILYFGTPVVLLSTENEDGTANLAPMSSVFWLGWRCMLGLAAQSHTANNLMRTKECVINLPSVAQVDAVDRLALTTGSNPVPAYKVSRGYQHVADKFAAAGLTPTPSDSVAPPRVLECPVQMEAALVATHRIGEEDELIRGKLVSFEVRIQRVHIDDAILTPGDLNRVDPDRWRPLLMSFQKFFGLSSQQVHPSRLASIPESVYRSPDVDWLMRHRSHAAVSSIATLAE